CDALNVATDGASTAIQCHPASSERRSLSPLPAGGVPRGGGLVHTAARHTIYRSVKTGDVRYTSSGSQRPHHIQTPPAGSQLFDGSSKRDGDPRREDPVRPKGTHPAPRSESGHPLSKVGVSTSALFAAPAGAQAHDRAS